jgi:3D (Asp-Asp-Asp) domain-containing protein
MKLLLLLMIVLCVQIPVQEPIIMEVWATAYSASEGFTNCRLLIAEGIDPVIAHSLHTCTSNGFEPDWGVCAVDPAYIPYGSIIYSREYADLCGHYAIAVDSGGAIKGYDVDYWVETTSQAYALTGYEQIKVLRWGWSEWTCIPSDWGLE